MGYITIASGLTIKVPTKGTRNWSDTLQTELFSKISSHDHTGSGKGVQIGTNAIAALAVNTSKIADGAVSFAKIASIATDRILGRDTAGSGTVEELTVGGGLEFSGTGQIRRSALTGDVTASAGSGSTAIANDAVTTAKILDGAVTEAKLADDAATRSTLLHVGCRDMADGTIGDSLLIFATAGTLNDRSIQTTMPKAGKITHLSLNLAPNSVRTGGSLTVKIFKNGGDTGVARTMVDSYAEAAAVGPVSFAAGDEIELYVSTSSVTFTLGTSYLRATLWGHFTE